MPEKKTPDFIDESALKEFSPIEARIGELKSLAEKHKTLEILDPLDKEQVQKVHEARMELRDIRLDTTKTGKALRADATKFSKWVIEQEKKLIAEIEPVEKELEVKQKAAQEIQEKEKRKKKLEENRGLVNSIFSHLESSEMLSVYNAASLEKGGLGLIVEDEKILEYNPKDIPELVQNRQELFNFWNAKISNIILTSEDSEALDLQVRNEQAPQFFDGMKIENVAEIFNCSGLFESRKEDLQEKQKQKEEQERKQKEMDEREALLAEQEEAQKAKIKKLEDDAEASKQKLFSQSLALHLEKVSKMLDDTEMDLYLENLEEDFIPQVSQSIISRKNELKRIEKEKNEAVEKERLENIENQKEDQRKDRADKIEKAFLEIGYEKKSSGLKKGDRFIGSLHYSTIDTDDEMNEYIQVEIDAHNAKLEKSRKLKKFLKDNDFDEKTDAWKESSGKVVLWRKIGEITL